MARFVGDSPKTVSETQGVAEANNSHVSRCAIGVLLLVLAGFVYFAGYLGLRSSGFFTRSNAWSGTVTVVSGKVLTKPDRVFVTHRASHTRLSRLLSIAYRPLLGMEETWWETRYR